MQSNQFIRRREFKRYTQFYYCYFIEVYDKTSTEFIYDDYYYI